MGKLKFTSLLANGDFLLQRLLHHFHPKTLSQLLLGIVEDIFELARARVQHFLADVVATNGDACVLAREGKAHEFLHLDICRLRE
jgi:hypothetical protein